MKSMRCYLLLVILFAVFGVQGQPPAARQLHALLVAPGGYAPESGWSATSGVQDLLVLRRSLVRHGFDTGRRVILLREGQATAFGIRAALSALLRQVEPGDMVQLHFSGHGALLMDDDGDEPDGYDEALAGYDAPLPGRRDFDIDQADRYLRDDEFMRHLDSLRRKLTASGFVFVSVDAGFLRADFEGTAMVRGASVALASLGYRPSGVPIGDPASVFLEGAVDALPETGIAPWVAITAAGAVGWSVELQPPGQPAIGAMTDALVHCLERLPKGVTGREVFGQLRAILHHQAPGQSPILEGDGLDRPFWLGAFKPAETSVAISRFERDGSLRLEAGLADGFMDSSRVSIFRAGTKPGPEIRPLATGLVVQSGYQGCRIVGARLPPEIPAGQLRAYLTEPAWLSQTIGLGFVRSDRDPGADHASAYFESGEVQELIERSSDQRYVFFPAKPEIWVRKAKRGYELFHGATGHVLARWTAEGEIAESLASAVRRLAMSRMLQRIPVFSGGGPVVSLEPADADRPVGRSAFERLSALALHVTNPSDVPMYVNLLELSLETGVRPRIPSLEVRTAAVEWVVGPRSTRIYSDAGQVFRLEGPVGERIFVWFLSGQPLDLRGLGSEQGYSVRGPAVAGFDGLMRINPAKATDAVRVPLAAGQHGLLFLRVLPNASGR